MPPVFHSAFLATAATTIEVPVHMRNCVYGRIFWYMHPNTNPFTPGAGVTPALLAGRDDLVERFTIAVERLSLGRPANGMMVYGLRGTGKTVLLNHFATTAAQRDWIVIQAEAAKSPSTSFLERVSGKLSLHLRRLVQP